MASIAAHHAEWLQLVDVSGPFLSVRVLKEALPNGLDAHEPHVAAEVRAALEQWADPDRGGVGLVDESELHLAFVRFVLHEVLGFDEDTLRWDDAATSATTVEVPHVGVLTPDAVVMDGEDAVMLVAVVGPGVRVDQITADLGTLTPQERMVEHLKGTGLRVGLVTDGERWTLVSYREGENPGFATWWSSLWGEEKITLQAFRTLLHQDRFMTMCPDETIVGLLDRSAEDQREVTTKLGNQTLQAVEILIRTIDRIDHERGGELLRDVPVAELYDAAVTVMMRLIFLFYAEENELLPVAEPLYNERYAASTLRERLQAAADQHGEEVLESNHDGWPRLLATWRAVFGGVEHGDMVLAPYGGSLFDPDRYPFLEGRQPETSWMTDVADPLPIDNRTVLHLLKALQTLEESGQRRKMSFRALDVEQIGHVYEGMLDHTAVRAKGWVLGLSGIGGKEPEVELDLLESFQQEELLNFLKEKTGRSAATLKKWIASNEEFQAISRFGATWGLRLVDANIEMSARKYAKLIRPDSTGSPTVFHPGSVYVTDSSHRGATGTHYTPRSLTEEVVKHALDPLIYIGVSDGLPEREWILRTPEEILDIKVCDLACGSGAFLVQSCRYLADALIQSRRVYSQTTYDPIKEDEITESRRQIVQSCLHGVDINPMACEMAKLSLWLITLARHCPFTFLDHAIRNGNSLIGVVNIRQIQTLSFRECISSPLDWWCSSVLGDRVRAVVQDSLRSYEEFRSTPTISSDDTSRKHLILQRAELSLAPMRVIADSVVIRAIASDAALASESDLFEAVTATARFVESVDDPQVGKMGQRLNEINKRLLPDEFINRTGELTGFHWPFEFPDIFLRDDPGFDCVIGNPPFLSGTNMYKTYGRELREHFVESIGRGERGERGQIDLCAFFLLRCAQISRDNSSIGIIATNTIAEGDTRQAGLSELLKEGWSIYRGCSSSPWPGSAALEICKVWLSRASRVGSVVLDGESVSAISSSLAVKRSLDWEVRRINKTLGYQCIGSKPSGSGFVLKPQEAASLIQEDPRNAEVVRPFLGGDDLNGASDRAATRWIINFGDKSLETAETYPKPLRIVEEKVRPARIAAGSKGYKKQMYERWWQFRGPTLELYQRIASLDEVLAIVRHSDLMLPLKVTSQQVFSDALVVFAFSDWDRYGVLSSSVHRCWAIVQGSTLGHAPRYTPSSCFETFAAPDAFTGIAGIMRELESQRKAMQSRMGLGALSLMQRVRDPVDLDPQVQALRALHQELDCAVGAAYGWSDIDYAWAVSSNGQLELSAASANKVVDRLIALNKQACSGTSDTPLLDFG